MTSQEKQGEKQFFAAEIFSAVKDYPMFSNIFVARIGNNKTEVGGTGTRQRDILFSYCTAHECEECAMKYLEIPRVSNDNYPAKNI